MHKESALLRGQSGLTFINAKTNEMKRWAGKNSNFFVNLFLFVFAGGAFLVMFKQNRDFLVGKMGASLAYLMLLSLSELEKM